MPAFASTSLMGGKTPASEPVTRQPARSSMTASGAMPTPQIATKWTCPGLLLTTFPNLTARLDAAEYRVVQPRTKCPHPAIIALELEPVRQKDRMEAAFEVDPHGRARKPEMTH